MGKRLAIARAQRRAQVLASRRTVLATDAAVESAKQAKRAVRAAWVGSVVNTLVVLAAFAVPALQKQWAETAKYVDQRQQDMRAIAAAHSQLLQASLMVSSGGLLEATLCEDRSGFNALDRAKMRSIQQRMNSLNEVIYQDGVKTITQMELQAAMIRVHDAVDNAVVTATAPADRSLTFQQRVYWCKDAMSDVAVQAIDLKQAILISIGIAYRPIKTGWLDSVGDESDLVRAGAELAADVDNVVIQEPEDK